MKQNIIIGIDGGLNGAITVIEGKDIIECVVMPVMPSGNGKNEYDSAAICKLLQKYPTATVVLEKAHAMPKLGTVQAFNFGKGYGTMLGILTALQMRYHIIHAKTWQTMLLRDEPHENTKDASVIVARRLFPEHDFRATAKSKKMHDGKTDSILLCVYAQRSNL